MSEIAAKAGDIDKLIELVSTRRLIELSHGMYRGMPGLASHPPYVFSTNKAHGDAVYTDGTSASNELIVMSGHTGTHLDALGHVSCGLKLHGGHDAVANQTGQGGLTVHGIEGVEPFLVRGVLIDVVKGRGPLEPHEEITVEQVHHADVQPGDAVLLRTGWAQYFNQPAKYGDIVTGVPGLGLEAARWLADRQPRLIGADNIALETFKTPIDALPVHNLLLVERGIHIVEMLDLEELAAVGATRFLFIALPLLLNGATASPVRPVALV